MYKMETGCQRISPGNFGGKAGGRAGAPWPVDISSFQACMRELVYGGKAVNDMGAAGLHFLHEVAGKDLPGKRGEGWRLMGSGGTGVVPKWAFWELVKALLRLTLWLSPFV